MTRPGKDLVEQEARSAFAFLAAHGFAGPTIQDRPDEFGFSVRYVRNDLGIEISLDTREGNLGVLLCRTKEGAFPEGGYSDKSGNRIRKYLATYLSDHGVPDSALRIPGKWNGGPSVRAILQHEASLLQKYGATILAGQAKPFWEQQG